MVEQALSPVSLLNLVDWVLTIDPKENLMVTYAVRVFSVDESVDLDGMAGAIISHSSKNIESVKLKKMGDKEWTEVKNSDFKAPASAPEKKATATPKSPGKNKRRSESSEVLGEDEDEVLAEEVMVDSDEADLGDLDVDALLQ